MSIFLAAGVAAVLPVVAISSDDERLDTNRTFISASAEAALAQGDSNVFCLDRSRSQRYRSICLTKAEWQEAIALAETAPKDGPRPFIPQPDRGTATGSSAQLYGRSR